MFKYVIRKSIWEYKMFLYGFIIRKLNNRVIEISIKREKEMKRYEKFKRSTKKQRSTLARYIHN